MVNMEMSKAIAADFGQFDEGYDRTHAVFSFHVRLANEPGSLQVLPCLEAGKQPNDYFYTAL